MRHAGVKEPGSAVQALEELIAAAAITGAPLHVVHIQSTGGPATPKLLQMISEAKSRKLDVTTECYPYIAGMTDIKSALFDEGWQEVFGIDYKDLQWAATGERLTKDTFNEYRKTGGMVAVFSSKGGCGTSFIATNLAAATNSKTILVDLNLQAGDLPLFLGLEAKYSIADMVEKRQRLDETLINSLVTPHSGHLSLLAAPHEADSADEIEPQHIFEVLEKLREHYDYVVLDPQHTFDSITLAALDQSDEIVLILTLDIPAIRSTQRALEIFDRLGYPRKKVRIVVNRWSKQIDLDLRQVEKFLGEPVIGFVPSDYQTAVGSINLGTPLIQAEPTSKIALEIRRIAQQISLGLAPIDEHKQRRPFWASLLKKQAAQPNFKLQASMEKV